MIRLGTDDYLLHLRANATSRWKVLCSVFHGLRGWIQGLATIFFTASHGQWRWEITTAKMAGWLHEDPQSGLSLPLIIVAAFNVGNA
ncbi:hypothetical protein D9613_008301 [Agrocybe pediades]|uniref:Uncharacterized protein n=1 Tax=Agrocybe pediades TaxID=84607 RepID=A0A8H4QTL6_9AGAR|nr:hypothetical protein D9613_008301 [Agrocybe pediades]